MHQRISRRGWVCAASAMGAWGATGGLAHCQVPVADTARATDGDTVAEPAWERQLTLTVGTRRGDLMGETDRVIQAALDYVARLGGGTVQLLPGRYTCRNAIFLPSGVRLRGSGSDSVITKIASQTVPLATDSDWYDQEITLQNSAAFRVGDGVLLRATNADHGGPVVIKRTLVAQNGNRFKLNDGLRENLWVSGQPTCSSLFPLLTSEHTQDVVIENLTLDGNRDNNAHLDGNYGGCVFLQDCNRCTLRNVETRCYHGDGISFQICHDVLVEDCYSHDNADLGVHPGSGSQRPVIRNCRMERNRQGLFWCWGVKHGVAEGNHLDQNSDYGISIGHCDTDNVMRNNHVTRSGKVGILFRDDDRGQDFWPHRNVLENNRVVDSGDEEGVAIDITGQPRGIVIRNNELLETRTPASRVGIRIGQQVGAVELQGNSLRGFALDVVDRRPV